jgi:hypothetical protein
MFIRNDVIKTCFCCLLSFLFFFLNCFTINANEELIFVKVPLSKQYIYYNDVISKYGEIWIGYTLANELFINEFGHEYFIIEKAFYFYKNNEDYILLGKIDKTGLYDKEGNCIKPISRVASGFSVIGISSSLIEHRILSPIYILQSQTNSRHLRETEVFALIDIDTQQDTIKLRDMSFFLQ